MEALTTRLPFGPRHIGLSDSTTIAILCALIELITESPENAKSVLVILNMDLYYVVVQAIPISWWSFIGSETG